MQVAGWGLTELDQTSEELKMATLPVVSTEQCLRSYPKFYSEYLGETAFCAGFRNGTSTTLVHYSNFRLVDNNLSELCSLKWFTNFTFQGLAHAMVTVAEAWCLKEIKTLGIYAESFLCRWQRKIWISVILIITLYLQIRRDTPILLEKMWIKST